MKTLVRHFLPLVMFLPYHHYPTFPAPIQVQVNQYVPVAPMTMLAELFLNTSSANTCQNSPHFLGFFWSLLLSTLPQSYTHVLPFTTIHNTSRFIELPLFYSPSNTFFTISSPRNQLSQFVTNPIHFFCIKITQS